MKECYIRGHPYPACIKDSLSVTDPLQFDELLQAVERGDSEAAAKLFPVVYDELRKLARVNMARESPDHTLQATALVHEAWIRLLGGASDHEGKSRHWTGRRHFFAAAALAMRRILVDAARQRQADRRGGKLQQHGLNDLSIPMPGPPAEIEFLNEALERLTELDAPAAELVHLRYFAGLTLTEAASAMEISPRSADRLWAFARAWLKAELLKD